ncbi:MAG: proteasome-type protease [Pseudomonadota bacterium]|nr:proteasome-type protease [Pseudomonadota bacterium]
MTYCVAITLNEGLLFASDSRTNAGVDNIASFCKMRMFERPGDRAIVTLTSGNLAISQGTINLLMQHGRDNSRLNLWNARSMYDAANLLGDALREVQRRDGPYLLQKSIEASSWFIIGGQIAGEEPRLFMVYTEGNCIEASQDTPFFQIGETKYGKPILDRVIRPATTLREAAKCVMVSFDSTMRSNISVGPPIDLAVIPRDELRISLHRRFAEDDGYLQMVHREWGEGLRRAFAQLADPEWVDDGHPRSTAP